MDFKRVSSANSLKWKNIFNYFWLNEFGIFIYWQCRILPTYSVLLLSINKTMFNPVSKIGKLREDVNCTEPPLSSCIPCFRCPTQTEPRVLEIHDNQEWTKGLWNYTFMPPLVQTDIWQFTHCFYAPAIEKIGMCYQYKIEFCGPFIRRSRDSSHQWKVKLFFRAM